MMNKNFSEMISEVIAFIYWLVKGRRQERNKRIAEALMGYTTLDITVDMTNGIVDTVTALSGPYYGEPRIWNGTEWVPLDEFHKNGR